MHDSKENFYTKLFIRNNEWSNKYPNVDEAKRWGLICECLSMIAVARGGSDLRILDIGCGRGWLTNLASTFGIAEGYDPVEEVIEQAKKTFDHIKFYSGTMKTVKNNSDLLPYDVIICSEVIEHVVDKFEFIKGIDSCLKTGGNLIVTTPRKEWYGKWVKWCKNQQPVEIWMSEKEVKRVFESYNFTVVKHSRIYKPYPNMSQMHRIAANSGFLRFIGSLGLSAILRSLEYYLSIYQVWWFIKR